MKKKYILWIEIIIIGILILILAGTLLRDPAFFTLQTHDDSSTENAEDGLSAEQKDEDTLIGPDISLEDMQLKLSPGIAGITCGDYYGSGVIIDITDEDIILVSAKHLLQNAVDVTIEFAMQEGGIQTASGRILALSAQYDIGFLAVAVSDLGESETAQLISCQMKKTAFDELKNGNRIIQIGSTDGVAADCYEGVVINKWLFVGAFNSFMLQTDSYAKEGMSGGGAFNAQGELVGIIVGGDSSETVCMPVNLILEEYEKLE